MPKASKASKPKIDDDALIRQALREVAEKTDAEVVTQLAKAMKELHSLKVPTIDPLCSEDNVLYNIDVAGSAESRQMAMVIRRNIHVMASAEPKDLQRAWAQVKGVADPLTCRVLEMMAEHNQEVEHFRVQHPQESAAISKYDWMVKKVHEIMITRGGWHIDMYLKEVLNLLTVAFTKWGACLAHGLELSMQNKVMERLVKKVTTHTAERCVEQETKAIHETLRSVQENNAFVMQRLDTIERELTEKVKTLSEQVSQCDQRVVTCLLEVGRTNAFCDVQRGRRRSPIVEEQYDEHSANDRQAQMHNAARRARSRESGTPPASRLVVYDKACRAHSEPHMPRERRTY